MLKFVILVCTVAYVFSAVVPGGMLPQLDGRIVGGITSDIKNLPWQVSIQRWGNHFCGGSILNENIIVTAAHCLQGASAKDMKVRVGSSYWNSEGFLCDVVSFKIHEGYDQRSLENDVAIMKLATKLTFSSRIRNIPLANKQPGDNATAVVSGWGTTTSGSTFIPAQLRSVKVKIVNRESCESENYRYGSSIKPSMICTYTLGKDACQGDSGGPLVSGNVLVGIVSWGMGCAVPEYPGVYADVAYLHSWIINTANYI
uniref:Serine protease 1 n=1 Tax=Hypoderma diana TaxID=170899 RepID=B5APZ4_9MUSC|nr:serine protease 1 [Hypoderma diana]